MGTTPGCSAEDNLDLLSSRKTPHGVVRNELGLKTEVSKVLLNLPTNEGTEETKALSFTSVDLENFLKKTS